ncbi:MAG TPA: TfoX/Sxy family protein [bacterium]|nr:TfoX/Sxy family protein [bacterium]
MAYDEKLAGRVRKALARYKTVGEIKMFGGLCFTLRGHMCCGVLKDELVIRVAPERYEKSLAKPHVRPMDFTGRPLKGFLFVGPKGLKSDHSLKDWIDLGLRYVRALPARHR